MIHILAKESRNGIIAFGAWILFCYFCNFSFGIFLGIIGLGAWVWAFRNPERVPNKEKNIILAPIDGEVIDINQEEKQCSITIKVRFFDCGFLRAPLECKSLKITKKSGLLLHFSPLANKLNEQITLKTASFEIVLSPRLFKVSHFKGENFFIGERIGFLKTGEVKVNLLKPLANLNISIGDRILAGQSIIGYVK